MTKCTDCGGDPGFNCICDGKGTRAELIKRAEMAEAMVEAFLDCRMDPPRAGWWISDLWAVAKEAEQHGFGSAKGAG
jgi:hypothetical protein